MGTGTHYNVKSSMKQFYNRSYYCDFCKVAYNNLECHKCDECCKSCNRIKCNQSIAQSCKMSKKESKNEKCLRIHNERFCKEEFVGIIFFDYEAYQVDGVHVPNLIMAKKICAKCIDAKEECEYCQQKYTFYDNNIGCLNMKTLLL
ncbi:unnamed protein product [Brachionus calyciflorus]|uniref:Uncharacterized protein n=1 Tax=Brachionus calyciflorus TaxID=104777 RepID=A0A814R7K4_9BILA|nr:unnamed protein product [Brachionus calyciflorus]